MPHPEFSSSKRLGLLTKSDVEFPRLGSFFFMNKLLKVRKNIKTSLYCTIKLGFPTGRDSATFRDNGTEFSSLSRDKGTTGQAQNFATAQ
jgi:hypothetical protein